MDTDVFLAQSDITYMMDHDEVCMAQANQLLSMGCLEYEAAVYGLAYLEKETMYFYLSSREASMKKFCQQACLAQRSHTPVRYFCKRYDLLEESEEEINALFRLEVARRLSESYPRLLLEAQAELDQSVSANHGLPILQEMTAALENRFDLDQLTLFANLLEMLLQGRQITRETYWLMQQWLKEEHEKNAGEVLDGGLYKRQYAGFAYEKASGERGCFIDALPHLAEEKQTEYISRGYVVTPILRKTYYADAFINPRQSRDVFRKALDSYLFQAYLPLMKLLRSLPPTIDVERYGELAKEVAATGKKEAIEAFRYYGYLCNAL